MKNQLANQLASNYLYRALSNSDSGEDDSDDNASTGTLARMDEIEVETGDDRSGKIGMVRRQMSYRKH